MVQIMEDLFILEYDHYNPKGISIRNAWYDLVKDVETTKFSMKKYEKLFAEKYNGEWRMVD